MPLQLKRPLIFFDLETTGVNPLKDRIVEISYLKVLPEGEQIEKHHLVNPGRHIPEEATKVHHITDEMVAGEKTFQELADEIFDDFAGCDIAGYNSNRFDIPLLLEEFERVGKKFELYGRNIIDVQNIFYKKEPRTLVAAYRFYCGKELTDAHSSIADTRATYEVFLSQLEKYDDLGDDMGELARFSRIGNSLDLAGRIGTDDSGEPIFNFGKHKGKRVREIFKKERNFYHWMMDADFSKDTKNVITTLYYEVYPPAKKQ